ncbi:hypothetical protein [Methylocystis sp. S23]
MSGAGSGARLSDEQLVDWLRLIRSENIGPRGIMAQTPQAQKLKV